MPLLGGYVFVSQFKLSRYFARRHARERLLLLAALAGVVFAALGRLLAILLLDLFPWLADVKAAVFNEPYIGSASLALLIGLVIWYPFNALVTETREIRWIIRYSDDYLQNLLYLAQKRRRMVQLTMKNGKVYVAHVIRVPLSMVGADSHIKIAPNMSGYRDTTTRRFVPTTFYEDVILMLNRSDRPDWLSEDDFHKVIPVHNIDIAGYFDPEAYLQFLREEEGASGDTEGPAKQ